MGRKKNRSNGKFMETSPPLVSCAKKEDIATIEPFPGMILPKCITGALCVVECQGAIVLVLDRLFQQKVTCCLGGENLTESLWTLPGGSREDKGKESLGYTAARELFEETRGLLLIPPSYFEKCEAIGAFFDITTHDGKRRVYYIRIIGDVDISLFDRKKKPNPTFNETGDLCLVPKVDFYRIKSFDGTVDLTAMLRRVSGRSDTASHGGLEIKTSVESVEKSCIQEAFDDELPPLPLHLLTNRTLNGVNSFLRGQIGLDITVQRTNKDMCKSPLAALGYSMYDLREVNVSYVANGCIDTPSRQGLFHPGYFNVDKSPEEAFGVQMNTWECCGKVGFNALPCQLQSER